MGLWVTHYCCSLLDKLVSLSLQLVGRYVLILHHLLDLFDFSLRFLIIFLTILKLYLVRILRFCSISGLLWTFLLCAIKLVSKHLTLIKQVGLRQRFILFGHICLNFDFLLGLADLVNFIEFICGYLLLILPPLLLSIFILQLSLCLIFDTILNFTCLCLIVAA